ncbi:MAG: DUF3089 domain-containing protein [bacterium]|nr:DUF3089 domain-containing protein [Gammaproteobacteria bacterium]
MLKKILIAVSVIIVVVVVVGYSMRESILNALIASLMSPPHDFDASLSPGIPDYTQQSSWAALPGMANASEDKPASLPVISNTNRVVDVFFVHPTSYAKKDNWNQPLEDTDANWVVDNRILRHQASVFNGCCEIYAPRYRQATIYSFIDQSGNGEQALDLAYQDVELAFDEFTRRRDSERPFILAGHSQGTKHATRLLREKIEGTPLQQKMVAAYLIGFSIEKDQIGQVATCNGPDQTGCVAAWNSVDGDGAGLFPDAKNLICVNPLTWMEDDTYAGHDLNKGSIGYPSWGPVEGEDVARMVVENKIADAQCIDGNLSVRELRTDTLPSRMQGDSMHVYDYSLFHMNIRENAAVRIMAYMESAD